MIWRKGKTAIRVAGNYGRFLQGLPAFLKRRMGIDEAKAILHQRMADREDNFLTVVERGIFGVDDTPYRQLLKLAGCEFADVEHGVRTTGIEATLEALRDAGVYVTFEEFWAGGKPIVRDGREIPVPAGSFENPLLTSYYQASTGGSTRAARPVHIGLEHLWARVPQQIVSDTIHGFIDHPLAIWFDGLPGNAPNTMLTRVAFDNYPRRWFSPTTDRKARPFLDVDAWRYRLAERGILTVARLSGVPLPRPQSVRLEQAEVIARWAADTLEKHGRCGIKTLLSRAVRICGAAEDLCIDLSGTTISGGGEPPTRAKASAVERTGARLICNYHFQEAGAIGLQCMNPLDENDQHLLLDHLAMITRHRRVPGFDVSVDAFCFTTLLPSARKLMLNVETDDYGIVETRDCDCPWEEFGFKTHLRQIRSFRKLTGEGVTLVGTAMDQILQEVLPERFGGSPLDYQLLEEEDERGFTRLSVIVSPKVEIADEQMVVSTVLDALGTNSLTSIWSQAGALRVRRQEPIWTARGKLMPLHFAGRADRIQSPSKP